MSRLYFYTVKFLTGLLFQSYLRLIPLTFLRQVLFTFFQSLTMNQRPEVWEGSEFILSCMAHGSPDIVFAWYKDGVKVNFNGTTRYRYHLTTYTTCEPLEKKS